MQPINPQRYPVMNLPLLLIFGLLANDIYAQNTYLTPAGTRNSSTTTSPVMHLNTATSNSKNLTPTPTWTDDEFRENAVPTGDHIDSVKESFKEGSNHTPRKHQYEQKPDSPTNFKVEPGDGLVHLSWNAMPRAHSYKIYISEDAINLKLRINKPIKTTNVTLGLLENGKTYHIAITAIGRYGEESSKTIQTVVLTKNK